MPRAVANVVQNAQRNAGVPTVSGAKKGGQNISNEIKTFIVVGNNMRQFY